MEKLVAFISFLLLLQYYVISSSAMNQFNISTDQLALLSLKSQIIFGPFRFLDESWSPATSVCHWVGVTCGSLHKRVKSLNLSDMDLNDRIPPDFGNLTFLVSLNLGSNSFRGNLPQEMAHLRRLKFLDLSFNSFRGDNLAFNSIEGQIPKVIGSLINLRVLKLRGNKLKGSIPLSLSNASRLETLDLSYNSLRGNIPEGIANLHNMNSLVIQFNQLMGSIPSTIFNISRIEFIAFTGNSLSGSLPNGLCNGLPILKGLYVSYNKLYRHMPTSLSNCSQLQILSLSENEFDGPIQSEIGRLSNLQILELGANHFTGSLPPNMGSILPNIEVLYLMNLTNLVETIPHSISNCSKLISLELSFNQLTGLIPNSLGYLTHLRYLNLGGNNLTSDSSLSFLTSLTNCRSLTTLSLYLNPLNGMLPASSGNLTTSLSTFLAISCKIQGRIPVEIGNLSSLLDLDLSGNNLAGSIPTSIGNLRNLQGLFLSSNKLTGSIVDNICKLQCLDVINLTQNQLSGSHPNCLGKVTSLREIHLGSYKLSSNIPPRLGNLHDLVVLDLSSNNMVGSLPREIGNLQAAKLIDLSMNQFSNGIPREIGGLQNLAHLSLRHNKLQGSIPESMSNMVGLEFLDLSYNNISGTIPKSLEKLQNLKYFNVSVYKLYGEIPSGGPFKNLTSHFFIHNEALCGSSRFSVPPCPTSSKHRSNRKKLLVLSLLLAIAVVFFPMTFVLLWIRYRRGKSAPQQAHSLSTVARERISRNELLQATDAFSESNLIGSGSFGSVYKGVLRSVTVIAVKVFNLQLDVAFKSFDMECEVLHSLRHRNLVKVITSCSNLDFKALVLKYMPNGSLDKYLYSHNYFLDIRQRLSIILDVACALEYLHHGCTSPVIYCDLKLSNVLLDEDMVAHLSDFGISKLLGEDESDLYTKTLETFGYIVPEYGLDGLVSTKCDVYSYGIMLLETFTRRKSNEFEGNLSLKQWVSYSLPDAVMEVVDANLVTPMGNHLQKELDVVASIMKLALDCCSESPARRTNLKDVVGMLQKIKIQILAR
ncbi:putative LRR receptor-like serine/threonine-protein kinase EFR-like [Capsicum annuum]|nr:putative LRR receptor-like serine/threonine-protein kinase EFR-like [Capsicum annuum]